MSANEQAKAMRAEFEKWMSDDGAWPQAVEKDKSGQYRLLSAASQWSAWRVAWMAALDWKASRGKA